MKKAFFLLLSSLLLSFLLIACSNMQQDYGSIRIALKDLIPPSLLQNSSREEETENTAELPKYEFELTCSGDIEYKESAYDTAQALSEKTFEIDDIPVGALVKLNLKITNDEYIYTIYSGETDTFKTKAGNNIVDITLKRTPDFYNAFGNLDITRTKDGETIISNPEASSNITAIWDSYVELNKKIIAKTGINYKISIDLKSDSEDYVYLGTLDSSSTEQSSGNYYKLSASYQTFSILTGTIPINWDTGTLRIAMGCAKTVYAKNFKIESTGSHSIESNIWYTSTESIGSIKTESKTADSVSITFNSDTITDDWANITLCENFEVGKMYKVTFDVTSNADFLGFIDEEKQNKRLKIWGHTVNNSFDTAGTQSFKFEKGITKPITIYLPVYSLPEKEQKRRFPHLSINAEKPCKIDITNIKAKGITLDEIIQENNYQLDIYFAGKLDGNWMKISNGNSIVLPVTSQLEGQVILSDNMDWSSTKNTVTSFRKFNPKLPDSLSTNRNEDNLVFTNNSSSRFNIYFGLDDDYTVIFSNSSAMDPCWYYYDLPLQSKINYIISNGSNLQKTEDLLIIDAQTDVFYFFGWEELDSDDLQGLYKITEYTAKERPSEHPSERMVRIYYYADKIRPYLYTRDVENLDEPFPTNRPGVKMIKYEGAIAVDNTIK